MKADDIRESNGTRVSGIDECKDRTFQTFAEVNWIANTKSCGVNVRQKVTRNPGELKPGVEGLLKPGVNLWGNLVQQMGGSGYPYTVTMVGQKVNL